MRGAFRWTRRGPTSATPCCRASASSSWSRSRPACCGARRRWRSLRTPGPRSRPTGKGRRASSSPWPSRQWRAEGNGLAILEMLPVEQAEREARLERVLDELAIKHLRRQKAFQLSGGERRRLEITRALVTDPKFMLLDEPFAGVDPIAVHDIQTIVAGLRHRGIGVLITDHSVEQTLDIVDRAYIMFEGKVQVSGSVRELVFNDRVANLS